MSAFLWVMSDEEGGELSRSQSFATQAEAEAWLSGEWADLAAQGAASVALLEDDAVVYQMSLGEA